MLLREFFRLISLAALFFSVIACTARTSVPENPNLPLRPDSEDQGALKSEIDRLEDQIHGQWLSSCILDGRRSYENLVSFREGGRFDRLVLYYSDASCLHFDYPSVKLQGGFKVRGLSPLLPGVYQWDMDVTDSVGGGELVRFDLLKFDGDRLFFGANPGDTEAARARELDPSVSYERVQ